MVLDRCSQGGAGDPFERIESVMDLLPVGIMLIAGHPVSDARVGRCNAACARMLGAAPEVGTRASDVPYAYFRKDRSESLPYAEWPSSQAIARGEPVHEEALQLRLPDGAWRVLSASAAPLRRDGRVQGAVVVYQDVTAQHDLESAARQSGERFQRLVASVPGVLYEFARHPDGTGLFSYLSPRCSEIFEIDVQTTMLEDMEIYRRMFDPEDFRAFDQASLAASRSGRPFCAELRLTTPSGRRKWLQFTSLPCPSAPGEPTMRSGFIVDVTERKLSEEALREADRRKSQFLAVLSHELRNPLAPIRNSLFLLGRAAPGSDEAERARQVIDRQTQHLTRLVDDLLDMTRISHGKIELHRKPLDLGEVVRRTCDDHRSLLEQRGVGLVLEELGPVWVDADETRIAQVIGNLLQNALKFTPRGGTTAVTVGIDRGEATVRVRDSGTGIEPGQVHRMFEPFAQADSSLAHPHGGLGLGLALAKGLMELHGGSVVGRSEGLGRGSEFTIRLPQGAPRAAATAARRPAPAPAGQLVLLIEDNADAAQTLAEVLDVSGYRVHVALDGRTGIACARKLVPDVVLCDIGLPDLDGYEVARTLRSDASLRSARLIALTGYAQPEDCARAMEAGFDAHLAKPASIDELQDLIAGR